MTANKTMPDFLPLGRDAFFMDGFVVYQFDTADGVPVYIGQTKHLFNRIQEHSGLNRENWWSLVSRVRIRVFKTRSESRAAEAAAIRQERPIANRLGRPTDPREWVLREFYGEVLKYQGKYSEAPKSVYEIYRQRFGRELGSLTYEDLLLPKFDAMTQRMRDLIHQRSTGAATDEDLHNELLELEASLGFPLTTPTQEVRA